MSDILLGKGDVEKLAPVASGHGSSVVLLSLCLLFTCSRQLAEGVIVGSRNVDCGVEFDGKRKLSSASDPHY
jgi:hypothetical protein